MDEWDIVFKRNLKAYVQLIDKYLARQNSFKISVEDAIIKLQFKLPEGLTKNNIQNSGSFPVVSQSKHLIVGYSDDQSLLVSKSLPLIVYGDHSKTIKYVDFPFIIGADGVKLLKPKDEIDSKFFYYCLNGIDVKTKNYGRHYGLVKKKMITIPKSLATQKKIVRFIEDLEKNCLKNNDEYFFKDIEDKIKKLHIDSIKTQKINLKLNHQRSLILKLRQRILQDAIEGKLTKHWREQNPDIEPARDLLKRIQAEKEHLIKEKKIKKQKALPVISEDQKPFELPDSWEWTRLGNVIDDIKGGGTPSKANPDYWNGGIPWASVKDLNSKDLTLTKDFISLDGLKNSSSNLIEKGNLIICTRMGLGKIAINRIDVAINQDLKALYINGINKKYFYNVYKTYDVIGSGMTVAGIRQEDLLKFLFPLPSLQEQIEIVKKVDNLFAICDELENQINISQTSAEELMQAVLKEAFSLEGKVA